MVRRSPARAASLAVRVFLVCMLAAALVAPGAPVFGSALALTGVVTASGGGPLENVEVSLFDDSGSGDPIAYTLTDASGAYSFATLPANGHYEVGFWMRGYDWTSIGFDYAGTPLVHDVELIAQEQIAYGTVIDGSSAWPIEDAWVDASFYNAGEDWYEWAGSGMTDVNGEYEVFDEMWYGAGDYEIYVYAGGYYADWVYDSWDGSSPLEKDFSLSPMPVVAYGTVTESDSAAPLEAWVDASIWNTEFGEWWWAASTGCDPDTGAYTLYDDMQSGSGEWRFDYSHTGHVRAIIEETWDGVTPLELSPNLEPAVSIATGTVTDSVSGEPVFDAWITASWYNEAEDWYEWTGSASTDEDGMYEVFDEYEMGAGDYEFYASAWLYADAGAYDTWNGFTDVVVDFELDPIPPLAMGTVVDAMTGEPLVDAAVDASVFVDSEDEWWWTGSGWSDENGEYTVYDENGWGAGSYRLTAMLEGYNDRMSSFVWDGATTMNVDLEMIPLGEVLETGVQGGDRFETAVSASQLAFPADDSCETAVVASGRNFPDALGGSALAGAVQGPVLLVEPTSLPGAVADEIERLGVSKVIVVGGESAVAATVKNAIDALPGVATERIAGANRYETARDVAQRTVDELGGSYDGRIMFATGTNFPDALAAAPLATRGGTPILLVKPTEVPAATLDALDYIAPGSGVVLGGTSAVGTGVYDELEADWFSADSLDRVAGTNRYETAAAIAQYGVDEYGLSWDGVAFATGLNFPDALAGGAAQGLTGSVVLLTKSTSLEPAPETKLEVNAAEISEVRFFGGLSAIAQSVRDDIMNVIAANKP